jgi:NAD(P)-dependent dehydrogenase (short-subunit alcohol dehydrogenase family)
MPDAPWGESSVTDYSEPTFQSGLGNSENTLRRPCGPGFVHSAAAKAGVKNLTESLAVEWGPYGIQVNGLVPGLVPHEDMTADIQGNLKTLDDKGDRQPAMRVGRPYELGWAATFLASPYGAFISGHTLVVDGANWQRRTLTNPPVELVREQMGRDPFEL